MPTNETPCEVSSFLQDHLNRKLLKYEAGRAIFCPQCRTIMDCRRTVIATLHRHREGQEEELVAKYVMCGKCWDPKKPTFEATVAKYPHLGARLEIVDGRVLFGRKSNKRAVTS